MGFTVLARQKKTRIWLYLSSKLVALDSSTYALRRTCFHQLQQQTAYRIAKSLKPFRSPITWSILECLENNLPVQLIDSYAASLKVDETYITPRLKFDESADSLQGVCYKHGKENPHLLKFDNFEEAVSIQKAVQEELIHVPKDSLVVGVNRLNTKHVVKVVICWPTCCKNDSQGTLDLFTAFSDFVFEKTGKNL